MPPLEQPGVGPARGLVGCRAILPQPGCRATRADADPGWPPRWRPCPRRATRGPGSAALPGPVALQGDQPAARPIRASAVAGLLKRGSRELAGELLHETASDPMADETSCTDDREHRVDEAIAAYLKAEDQGSAPGAGGRSSPVHTDLAARAASVLRRDHDGGRPARFGPMRVASWEGERRGLMRPTMAL